MKVLLTEVIAKMLKSIGIKNVFFPGWNNCNFIKQKKRGNKKW